MKWGIKEQFKKGSYHCFRLYGYDWDGEKYVVVPEEAKVVKAIFDDYLAGTSTLQIAKKLGKAGIKRKSGGAFRAQEIRFMLRQEKYVGDMLCQKTFITDPLTHRKPETTARCLSTMCKGPLRELSAETSTIRCRRNMSAARSTGYIPTIPPALLRKSNAVSVGITITVVGGLRITRRFGSAQPSGVASNVGTRPYRKSF